MKSITILIVLLLSAFTLNTFAQTFSGEEPTKKIINLATKQVNGKFFVLTTHENASLIVTNEDNQLERYIDKIVPNVWTSINGDGYRYLKGFTVTLDTPKKVLVRSNNLYFPEVTTLTADKK